MMLTPTVTSFHELTIDIGEVPILVRTDSVEFARLLAERYGEFVARDAPPAAMELEIELFDAGFGTRDSALGKSDESGADPDLRVRVEGGRWVIERGDFAAQWDAAARRGWVRQTANPYSIDSALRILHSLVLARTGGFLLHAASAVRNGRAFALAGVSGAGKTTISRLAPPDVILLSDEITYIRDAGYGGREAGPEGWNSGSGTRDSGAQVEPRTPSPELRAPSPVSRIPHPVSRVPIFEAFGTPFAGELARIGHKVRAPLAALFLLGQGPENRIEPVSATEAVRELMRHVLFFAHDEELAGMVFQTVCNFAQQVPIRRLVFVPEARVWEMIG